MRMIDWSSDVCSSDLTYRRSGLRARRLLIFGADDIPATAQKHVGGVTPTYGTSAGGGRLDPRKNPVAIHRRHRESVPIRYTDPPVIRPCRHCPKTNHPTPTPPQNQTTPQPNTGKPP